MTNQTSAFQPAIDALEKDVKDLERQWNALLSAIAVLRQKAGLPPRPGSSVTQIGNQDAAGSAGQVLLTLHSDSFLGKKMGAAAREYLQMRKAGGGDAPATVREIFDNLKAGGFDFKSKDDGNAIIVLRAMLRKNSSMFHRLQNGKYGLLAWYPTVKPPKPNIDDLDIDVGDDGQPEKKATDTAEASAA